MSEDSAIIDAANLLGIDLRKKPEYSWIVSRALDYRFDPEEWKEIVRDDGQYAYYNVKSGVCVLATRRMTNS